MSVELDYMHTSQTRLYACESNSITCMRVELGYMHASRTQLYACELNLIMGQYKLNLSGCQSMF